jgi:hypothetical protein
MVERNLPPNAGEPGHELSDLSPTNIALFGAALAATIVAVLLVTYGLFRHFYKVETRSRVLPSPLSYTREPTPEPHLLVRPGEDLKTMRKAEDVILRSYDWIDRDKGIVRIPIDRAIEILARRGLPTRAEKGRGGTVKKPGSRKEGVKR